MKKKYKATALVQWTIEVEDDGTNPFVFAKEEISKILSDDFFISIPKIDKCKKKVSSKLALGEFLPEDVLPYATIDEERREYCVGGKKYLVKMNSQRYFVFRNSIKCVACGLEGIKMLLEKHANAKHPHFNLYALEDGELILMTKDHIIAKSSGGEDIHSNYQTMCSVCNNLKGSSKITIEGVKVLRDLYNQNKNKLSTRELSLMIAKKRKELDLSNEN